ncbi:MAG: 50S ribosomal protein L32 [Candidatus Omnitrophota bacterium]
MPNPRRRHSKARGRRRRTHWKLETVQLMVCSQCKSPKLPHRICTVCGYYNGKPVLNFEAKRAKKEEKKKKAER